MSRLPGMVVRVCTLFVLALAVLPAATAQQQLCERIQLLQRSAPNDFEEVPAVPDFLSDSETYLTEFVPAAFKGTIAQAMLFPGSTGEYLYSCTWSYGYGLQEQARAAADAAALAAEIGRCTRARVQSLVDEKDKSRVTYTVFPDGPPDGKSRKTVFTIQANPTLSFGPPAAPDPSRQGILSLAVEAHN